MEPKNSQVSSAKVASLVFKTSAINKYQRGADELWVKLQVTLRGTERVSVDSIPGKHMAIIWHHQMATSQWLYTVFAMYVLFYFSTVGIDG